MIWSAPHGLNLKNTTAEMKWPKQVFFQGEVPPSFGDNFVNDTDEDRKWKNMVHEEFGLKKRSAFTRNLRHGNHSVRTKPLNWKQPRIKSLATVVIGEKETVDENKQRNARHKIQRRLSVERPVNGMPNSVRMAVEESQGNHFQRYEQKPPQPDPQKKATDSKVVTMPKMLEKNANGFRSVLIDLEQRVKSLASAPLRTSDPSTALGILAELSEANSITNGELQNLLRKLIPVLEEASIKTPAYENSLIDDVEFYRDYVRRIEYGIESLHDEIESRRAEVGKIVQFLNAMFDKASEQREMKEMLKVQIKESKFDQLLIREDIIMLESEIKMGSVEEDAENAKFMITGVKKEALKIIHEHQTTESDSRAMRKIIKAYAKQEDDTINNSVPKKVLNDRKNAAAKLKIKTLDLEREYHEERKSALKFSKIVYEKSQKVISLRRNLRKMKKAKEEFLRSNTPRPKWNTLRQKIDMLDYRKFLTGTIEARIPSWEEQASTAEITQVICQKIHDYVSSAKTESSVETHRLWESLEEIESKLRRWVTVLPEDKQKTEVILDDNEHVENDDMLKACGNRPDVPLPLRCGAKLEFPRHKMSLTFVRNEIRTILKAKATFDHTFGHISLSNFIYDYGRLEYGDSKQGGFREFTYNFINSVRRYRAHDGLCDMFYDVFSQAWDEHYLHDLESMFGALLLEFEREGRRIDGSDENHNGTLPLGSIGKVLAEFFPRKSGEDISALLKTLEKENKKMHKLLMAQSLESHCDECEAFANENAYHEPECLYYRHMFAHYYGIPVCALHAIGKTETENEDVPKEREKDGASNGGKKQGPARFVKRGVFQRFSAPDSHKQHEDTHGNHHKDNDKTVEGHDESQTEMNPDEAVADPLSLLKKHEYWQRKTSFLDLLMHQYKVEVNEFVDGIKAALEGKDYTCRSVVSTYTIRNVLKEVEPELSTRLIYKYCELGIADWVNVAAEKFKRKRHVEVYIDIDVFVNNLRSSFVRPYDIYKGAVSDCGNHDLRPVISFGANVL
jgi:hypothetical protein